MESGDERDGVIMFSDEDLCEMSGLKRGRDFIEVMCGCTSQRYGDAVGRLKVFASGDLEISCECTPGCQEDKLSPSAFEKHSGREGTRKWKSNVWVMVKGEKVSLAKTVLLKYYNEASKNGNGSNKGHNGRPAHRDEFIRCSRCSKERRFRLRTKEECRIYHDASADINWNCSDLASDNRPDLLDAALLRPGRLDRLLFCDFPSLHERLDILTVLSRKLPLACDVDLDAIASETNGFSGADLQALLSDAQLASVHELLQSEDGNKPERIPVITDALLKSVASKARPSVSKAEKRRLNDIYSQFMDSKKSVAAQSRDTKGKRATLA